MIFDFLKRHKQINDKKKLIKVIIVSLNIPDEQKELFLESISILDEYWLEKLYEELSLFIKQIEEEELNNIWKNNFSYLAWMKKKEVEEKQKEINSFSFLINNL